MKIVKGIVIALAIMIGLFILCMIFVSVTFGSINKKEQKDQEKIMESGAGDKKALILYQNSKGSTVEKCVDPIAEALQEDGYEVTMNHPRSDTAYTAADYEVIVLASPVYFGQIAQPLCDYADQQDFSNSRVFILVTGHIKDKNEVGLIEEHVKNAKAVDGVKAGRAEASTIQALQSLIGE